MARQRCPASFQGITVRMRLSRKYKQPLKTIKVVMHCCLNSILQYTLCQRTEKLDLLLLIKKKMAGVQYLYPNDDPVCSSAN